MTLKGLNLGSWLNPEGYILGGRNIAYHEFEEKFLQHCSIKDLKVFNSSFRHNYISEDDFAKISSWGAGLVRLPVNYRFLESSPYVYDGECVNFVDNAFSWAEKYGLLIMLDLHAACGSQNCDWHADSSGIARLWDDEQMRKRTYALWSFLANRYSGRAAFYGYDLLNEPVLGGRDRNVLIEFYSDCIRSVRQVDKKKPIYIEGDLWGQDVEFLEPLFLSCDNVHLSVHAYAPIDFSFNFKRDYRYPGMIQGQIWDIDQIRKYLARYRDFAQKHNIEVHVGEFGINFRDGAYGELNYIDDMLTVFGEYGFHWTYWTYKCVAQGCFPDGIVQYVHNPTWIRREGPLYGLETMPELWAAHSDDIVSSWKTDSFSDNVKLLDILKKHFAGA